MTSRKIVAVFDTPEAAQNARRSLMELGLQQDRINITDQSSSLRSTQTHEARGSFWAHIKEMFMPEEDRHAYEEGLRRGSCMLVATVDDAQADDAIARLETAGAIDLNERESHWRTEGWTPGPTSDATAATQDAGGDSTASDGQASSARLSTSDAESERIPLVAEQLR
ncbi:MAG: hypothetical protein JOZ93_15465, partial [Sinobacteraceae bacterium]|nr:hypothetical protein [Nevskiaceae bacterium]